MARASSWSTRGIALSGVLVCAAAAVAPGAAADPALTFPVVSDFTSHDEAWMPSPGLERNWIATGGNPGAYIQFIDHDWGPDSTIAPPKFYGDWRPLDGSGAISFDLYLIEGHVNTPVLRYPLVDLVGPGGRAIAAFDCLDSSGAWRTYRAPLERARWALRQGTWEGLLADVTNLRLVVDFTESDFDTVGLDNVYVGAGPPAAWCLSPLLADLHLISPAEVTFTPSLVLPGGTFTNPLYTWINDGAATAAKSAVGYYLSPDSTITASDTYLGGWLVDSLRVGHTGSRGLETLRVPPGTPFGSYYAGILVDNGDVVRESSELNNWKSGPLLVSGPDLALAWSAPFVTPGIARPGEKVRLGDCSVTNVGPLAAGSFWVGLYLSVDASITGTDVYLGDTLVAGLAPGARCDWAAPSPTIPLGTVPGDYYIGILVDRLEGITELSESNNALSAPMPIRLPDLAIQPGWSLLEGPLEDHSGVEPGGSVAVSPIHFINHSGAGAGLFEWGVYLSSDLEVTPGDPCLHISQTAGLPGWQANGWPVPDLRIPPETVPGDYYLIGFVDCHQACAEENEANNQQALPITVLAPGDPVRRGYVTNGPVLATVIHPGYPPSTADSILYLGGDFTQIGPATGSWVRIDAGTGQESHPYPDVAGGRVLAAASDSAGGWFIGGDFTSVAGSPRRHLAHILADGTVAAWDPGPDSVVYALAYRFPLDAAVVVAGGRFTRIGGASRLRLAALDANTGAAVPGWDADADGPVFALALAGADLFVGGDFTTVRGEPRERLAWLDVTHCLFGPPISPGPDAAVRAIAVHEDRFPYGVTIGGDFHAVGGVARNHLARLGGFFDTITAWDPSPDGPVYALALAGTRTYVGGDFTSIAGSPCPYAAAVDSADGSLVAWEPGLDATVHAIAADQAAGLVYLAGDFTSAGGAPRNYVAALDTMWAVATPWDPNANLPVSVLMAAGSRVFAGGELTSIGGVRRNRLAAIDVGTGLLTPWDPDADGAVLCIYPLGDSVFVGGAFTQIGGEGHGRLACLDRDTGAPQSWWVPELNDTVRAVYPDGEAVWVGGDFTLVSGAPFRYLASVDGWSGAPWWHPIPPPNGRVRTLMAVSDQTWPYLSARVFVGGDFTRIAGQYRDRGAAFDLASKALQPWDPDADAPVHALAWAPWGYEAGVMVGGEFDHAGGVERHHIALVDSLGAASAWDPDADGTVRALIPSPQHPSVIVGGDFTHIGAQPRAHLAEVILTPERDRGGATLTDISADGPVFALATFPTPLEPGTPVFAGGSFLTFDGMSRSYLGSFWFADLTDVGDGQPDGSAAALTLQQSFPNPLRGAATIRFTLSQAGPAMLRIYDLRGRQVRTLVDGACPAGTHAVRWERDGDDGARVGPGAYFYELRTPGQRLTRKLVVLE